MKKWVWFGLLLIVVSACRQNDISEVVIADETAMVETSPDETHVQGAVELASELTFEPIETLMRPTRTPGPTEIPMIKITVPPDQTPLAEMDGGGLSEEGPWFIMYTTGFPVNEYIWSMSGDGSGFSKMMDINHNLVSVYPSPRGDWLMVVGGDSSTLAGPPEMMLIHLPSGNVRHVTQLIADEYHLGPDTEDSERFLDYLQTYMSVVEAGAWSHSGNYFAFSGVLDGPSSDLYVFDLYENEIIRLTDGPFLVADVFWSPDDRYIVHRSVSSLGYDMGGSDGHPDNKVWVADRETGEVRFLYEGIEYDYGIEHLIAWVDDDTYLADTWRSHFGYIDLRLVHLDGREDENIFCDFYWEREYDLVTRTMVFFVPGYFKEWRDCGSESGFYYYSLDTEELTRVAEYLRDDGDRFNKNYSILNLPKLDGFYFYKKDDVIGISYDGELIPKIGRAHV